MRDSQVTRTATCACGQLSVTCTGEPALVSLCHCRDCQLRTGSAFGVAAFFRAEEVTPRGDARRWERVADSGYRIAFHFCPVCGSTVYWEPERKVGMVAVALGAFADPSFPAPVRTVYTEH
jgi:hypothetical protein